jgi:hypothetical protein
MTNALPSRVAALRASLTSLDAMATDVQETALLTDLQRELAKSVDALDRSLVQCQILAKGGVTPNVPASLVTARTRAATLRQKFAGAPRSATLKSGTVWTTLLRDVGAAATDAETEAKMAWKDYRGTIFTGDTPAVIRGRIGWSDENKKAFERYERKFQNWRATADPLPSTASEVATVKAVAADLKSIAGEFDFDVPAEVKKFLDAVQANGAALALLTPAVVEWLKKKNAFASYRIVPTD